MRDRTLHAALEAFTADAADSLNAATAEGAEIPFEVADAGTRPGGAALYCYRPLTGEFISDRLGLLRTLTSYGPAAQALAGKERLSVYLRARAAAPVGEGARGRADGVLLALLTRVFAERSEFGLSRARFESAYAELERALFDGHSVTTALAALHGLALDPQSTEFALGEGLSLIRGEAIADPPADSAWTARGGSALLLALSTTHDPSNPPPVSIARERFERFLTAIRLYQQGRYTLGPLGWTRTDAGPWQPVGFGERRRPKRRSVIAAAQEDELRAFYNLVARRKCATPELEWALDRFEMGNERTVKEQALSDYLLALRALLEPEGPASGRLAQRLAVLCAHPQDRAGLTERTARAVVLERSVIAGHSEPATGELVDELGEHLRALLRDALCGHLAADLDRVADELVLEEAGEPVLVPALDAR